MADLTTLFNFPADDNPDGVTVAPNGDLIVTTLGGGADGYGAVWRFAKTSGGYVSSPTLLWSFTSGADGAGPTSGVTIDANGNLFGQTDWGGASSGTIYEIAMAGGAYASAPSILWNFPSDTSVISGLAEDAQGDLFAATGNGGANDEGMVFELARAGGGYASAPTVLWNFSLDDPDGYWPSNGVTIDAAGDIFGNTEFAANSDFGTTYEIAKLPGGYASAPTVLASSIINESFVDQSQAPALDANGDLFIATSYSYGAIYEIAKTSTAYAAVPTLLWQFTGGADGAELNPTLLVDGAGDLFGTTELGGANGYGVAFEIAKTATGYASAPTILWNFVGGFRPSVHCFAFWRFGRQLQRRSVRPNAGRN